MSTSTEVHDGRVTDNNDPEKKGRLKVASQGLLGAGLSLPMWIPPENQWFASAGGAGALFLPAVESSVELIVHTTDSGLDERPGERFLDNPDIRWRPAQFTSSAGANPLPAALAGDNYPNVRGWVTVSGHVFTFDDTPGAERVQLIHANGGTFFDVAPDGSILILTAGGALLWLRNDDTKGVFLIDPAGNSVSLDATGTSLISRWGQWITMKDGAVDLVARTADTVNILGGQINLDGGTVNIGGLNADEKLVKGATLKAWLEAHKHGGGTGPTGPPLNNPLSPGALSADHSVK